MSLPTPTDADIQRIVDLVVAEVAPLRVVLFGSRARGDHRVDSDVDLMVVMPEDADCKAVTKALYRMARPGVIGAVDFVVATPSRYERLRQRVTLIYRQIDQEGRELYAA